MNTQKMCSALATVVAFISPAHAQTIQVMPPGTAIPGGSVTVMVTNDQSTSAPLLQKSGLVELQPTGELIFPEVYFQSDSPSSIPLGQSWSVSFPIAASGVGSSGSFLLYYPYGKTAVARLDVAAPDLAFPALHAFPANVIAGYRTYLATIGTGGMLADWKIANASSVDHLLGAQDAIHIYAPGSSTLLATRSLAGIPVVAGRSVNVPLPLDGLPIGPYDVVVSLNDPSVGAITRRAGIQPSADWWPGSMPAAVLQLPGGTQVPTGGSLPAYLRFSTELSLTADPVFGLLIGFAPGSTSLKDAPALPLALDALVLGSLTGLGGVLPGNVGPMKSQPSYCWCPIANYRSDDLSIVHPNVAALGGVELRAAAVLFVPGHGFTASQSMPLRFE